MILVVDDDLQMLGFLREVLEKDGYEVEAFNEPYQALRFCGQEVPNLIISEVRMAEMSGFDFLHTYRTRHAARKTPFVFLSALSRPEQISRGLDKGADDYLTKPIDPGLLCAKVRSHLRQANAFGLRVTRGNLHQLPFTALIRQCERSGLTGILEVFGEDKPLETSAHHIQLADTRHRLGKSDPADIDLVKLGWTENILI